MLESKISENEIQEKIQKKKTVAKEKSKLKTVQSVSKNPLEMVWYASTLF